MATFAPTRNASPHVWRISTNGNAQTEGSSRSQILSAVDSIQVKRGSTGAAYCAPARGGSRTQKWRDLDTRPRQPTEDERVGVRLLNSGSAPHLNLSERGCRRLPDREHEPYPIRHEPIARIFKESCLEGSYKSGLLNPRDPDFRIEAGRSLATPVAARAE
jgi:hypothetical protein